MNELYCKKCGARVGTRGQPDYPLICEECGTTFRPERIPKAIKHSLMFPGGGILSSGKTVRGACWSSIALNGLFFGSLCFGIIAGTIICGAITLLAVGDTVDVVEDIAGYSKHQMVR